MKQNMKNQTICELCTNDKNLSQLKAFLKNFIQKKQRPKLPLLNLLVKPLQGQRFPKERYKIYKFSYKY